MKVSLNQYLMGSASIPAMHNVAASHDYVNAVSADGIQRDGKAPVDIFPDFESAISSLRLNRRRGKFDKPTIGRRFDFRRSHIAYAWAPSRRKVNGKTVFGPVCLHVLHATKGWRILHGISA